jgi:hypothetical protein
LSTYAAAAAVVPSVPEPWKAFGDVLWDLSMVDPSPTPRGRAAKDLGVLSQSSVLSEGSQVLDQGKQRQMLLPLVAEAYCQYLRAGVVSRRLTAPEDGMEVLLRLLQLVLHHASDFPYAESAQLEGHQTGATTSSSSNNRGSSKQRSQGGNSNRDLQTHSLWQCLSSCPAAAWQALTPQLMGQLMKSEQQDEVRGLLCGLLRAVAVAVPCSVLYPAVMELRNAQVTGKAVRSSGS